MVKGAGSETSRILGGAYLMSMLVYMEESALEVKREVCWSSKQCQEKQSRFFRS